jgi:hypothetical protein
MENIIDNCNWISLLLSFVSIAFTTLWIFVFRPRLKIEKDGIENNKVRIKVTNIGCANAINLKMEVCTVKGEDEITRHLELDRNDFLLLPRKGKEKERVFKAFISDDTDIKETLRDKDTTLRVRLYAAHELSGFGKTFQRKYRYNPDTGELENV